MALMKGRRPVNPERFGGAMRFADIRSGVIPDHPLEWDTFASFAQWDMLLNDTIGDCVVATWANFRRVMTALAGAEHYPISHDTLIKLYQTQNPGFKLNDPNHGPGSNDDNGMNIEEFLTYLRKTGGPDGAHVLGFAKVDHTNVEEVEAAIAIFGGVWVGINVLDNNMREFNQGQPWSYDRTAATDGGHSIIGGGYTSIENIKFITWARETEFTPEFWLHQVEECWVVIWPENLGTRQFRQGIDLAALAAAFSAVTNGGTFPAPLPVPPQPAPTPPAPVQPSSDPDQILLAAAREFLLHKHSGAPAVMARDLRTWAHSKGFQL